MSPQLLLSLTHDKLHAHNTDLTPASIPHSTPTAIAASSTYIAEASQSSALILRDPFTLHQIHTLPAHTSSATTLAISAVYLAAGHTDGTVSLHNLSSHHHVSFIESSPIVSLAYPTTARYLAAATASAIALFSTVSNRLITRLTQPATRSFTRIATAQARFTAVAFSPIHPSLLAATDDTGCLTVYDISTVLSSARTHPMKATPTASTSQSKFPSALKAPSTDLSFSSGGYLAVAGFDKLIRVFNPSLKQLLFTITLPSPIASICYGPFIAVGLTDASIAIVRLDFETASGTVVNRVFVDAGIGAGRSRAVKRILFQPKPKRRKPPRSATPLNISSHEVNEDMLADVDDIIGGKLSAKTTTQDEELFSPVRARSPQTRPPTGKAASFHASPTQREVTAPRSRSVQSITTHGNALEKQSRCRTTAGEQQSWPSKDEEWDDMFVDDVDGDNLAPTKVIEDSFEGFSKWDKLNKPDNVEGHHNELPLTRDYAGQTHSSGSYTQTSSSAETRLFSKENLGRGKIVENMSDMQMTSSHRKHKERDIVDEGKARTVRFEYLKDVMLGQPVLEMESTKDLKKKSTSVQEQVPERREDFDGHERTMGTDVLLEKHTVTHKGEVAALESVSKPKHITREPTGGVTEDQIRDIIRQEVDVVRSDLRSDILNIHTELVTLATRQSQEIATVLRERDHTIKGLEEEVRRLHADNTRLRRKYGIG